jgi:CxxC-x17-CxxC domain-containing protein
MNDFKKGGFRKGNGGFEGKPRFGGSNKFGGGNRGGDRGHGPIGDSREREMFKAKCSSCFKACEVPFRPTNGKPVFCRECFADNAPSDRPQGRGDSRDGGFRRDARPERSERPMRHEGHPGSHGGDIADLKQQLSSLQKTVDYIADMLKKQHTAPTPTVKATSVTAPVEAVTEAPKKVRKPKTEKKKAPAKAKKVATKKKAK